MATYSPGDAGVGSDAYKLVLQYLQSKGLSSKININVLTEQNIADIANEIDAGTVSPQDIQGKYSVTQSNLDTANNSPTAQPTPSLTAASSQQQIDASLPPGYQAPPPTPQYQLTNTGQLAPAQTDPNAPSNTGQLSDVNIGQKDWDTMSQILGYNAQQAYQAQLARATQAIARNNARRLAQANDIGQAPPPEKTTPGLAPTPVQWLQQQQQAAYGEFYWIINQYADTYEIQNGQAMPAKLRQQMAQALAGAPEDLKRGLRQTATTPGGPQGTTATGLPSVQQGLSTSETAQLGFLSDIMSNYEAANPSPEVIQHDIASAQASAMKSNISSWINAFGSSPTANQTSWMTGKSGQEVQDFIDAQPSRVSGLNYGQYSSIRKMGDPISQQLWGHPLDDAVLSSMSKEAK